ncbi:MAG: inosine/guanosine kinase [Elusimicrobia bacterium CG_4_10_14_0_2_um_filter_56_8]|nr:MAG: inosine/guanosine kinase [Elusimicrobia bacterium CG1_02_56_21]PJA14643.1 MAG: inosine/guanosine kinase [Elusimicrobia bacterium CG_4_10_14_0_2_um_filter_56_8]
MKFPGKRKNKHYFPVASKGRESADPHSLQTEPFYLVGIDQLLVDIECRADPEFLDRHNLKKGQSQILGDSAAEAIYRVLKTEGRILGEYAGGSVGNTLHNYSVLSEERSVALGAITRSITVGDYAFKYIRNTSAKVDLSYLQPSGNPMGRAMCFVTPDGERTFGISKGCMNDLAPEFIPVEVIEKASALLISSYILRDEKDPIFSSTVKACETALKAKVPVVMTLGTSFLIESKKDFFREFIKKYVTCVAMNDLEALALTGLNDPLLAAESALELADLVLLTVGPHGLYLAGYVDEQFARKTTHKLHTKSIVDYNMYEFSRPMRKSDCAKPIKIYTHINPFLGGPLVIKNTNGAGDGALAAILHDLGARKYHQAKVPNSPKNLVNALSYSSLSQISKYANRVSFEVLAQNSPRLMRALPEKEDSLQEAYWDA